MKYWEDFQTKWGFADGDSVPPDALLIRQVYIGELNRELEKRQSGIRLLAWDRPGMHNPYLIVRVNAAMVRNVPAKRLFCGQQSGGWEPKGDLHEPEPDEAFNAALVFAQEMELDDRVVCIVTLREDQKRSRPMRWLDITDDHVRHRWNRDCPCVEVEESVYVDPDSYENGGIPICEECGTDRKYVKTQIKGKR